MAKFGYDATNMGEANTKAAKFVKDPVSDMSSVIAVQGVGQALGMAWEGYNANNKHQLNVDIDQAGEDYTAKNAAFAEAQVGMTDAGGQRQAVNNIWNSFDDVDMNKVNTLETSIKSNLDKYKTAYEQGGMSSDELVTRINTATRSAVARSPGMAKELVAQAGFYQELTGVSDLVKSAKTMEKEQKDLSAKRLATEDTQLVNAGINPNTLPPAYRAEAVEYAFKQVREANDMKQFLENAKVFQARGELDAAKMDGVLITPKAAAARVAYTKEISNTVANNLASGAFLEQYKGLTLSNVDKNLKGITDFFATERSQITSLMAQAGPKGKPIFEDQLKQYDEYEKLYTAVAKGGPQAEVAKNLLEARQSALRLTSVTLEHQLSIANQYGSAMKNLKDVGMAVPNPNEARVFMQSVTDKIQNFQNGFGPSPLSTIDLKTKEGQQTAVFTFSTVDPKDHPYMAPDQVVKENDRNIDMAMKQFTDITEPKQFVQSLDSWMKVLSQEATKSGVPISTRYSPAAVEKVNTFLADVINNSRSSGRLEYNDKTNTFSVTNPNGTKNSNAALRVNNLFKGYLSFNGFKEDANVDQVGDALFKLTQSKYREEQGIKPIKGADGQPIDPSFRDDGKKFNMKIPASLQAQRNETQLYVLEQEILDNQKKASTEKDPKKKQEYLDNVKYINVELASIKKGK